MFKIRNPIIVYLEIDVKKQFIKNFGREPTHAEFNALTHAYTSAKFATIGGHFAAKQLGDLNEKFGDNQKFETAKDQYNNRVGRKIGMKTLELVDKHLNDKRFQSTQILVDHAANINAKRVANTLRNGGLRLKADSTKEFEVNPKNEKGHWVTINGRHLFLKN
jgi:hypothetical protein